MLRSNGRQQEVDALPVTAEAARHVLNGVVAEDAVDDRQVELFEPPVVDRSVATGAGGWGEEDHERVVT